MKKNIINRTHCVCNNKLEKKINFGSLPLINNYKTEKNLKKYPITITQCKKCLLIQLKYSVPDKLLFPYDYSYLSGNSKEKISNFETILSKIKTLSQNKNPQIMDIGSNDGSFLNLVKNKYPKVLGIEPTNTANISIKRGVNTIKKALNLELAKKIIAKYSNFDFIVASNIFAHTNNLKEIINSVKLILKQEGLLIIEVQYLYSLINQKGFDSLHHEHVMYYTLSSITKLLEKYQLYIFDAEILKVHGGILRVYASLDKRKLTKNFKRISKNENDKSIIYKVKRLNKFRIKFNKQINTLIKKLRKEKKKIYGMGAAPRGCVLLNSCQLTKKEIGLIGEVSQSLKCNKYVPGTDIMVKNENRIITDKVDYVIILAWHLKKLIVNLLLKKGYKGKFIVPLPNLKIIKK